MKVLFYGNLLEYTNNEKSYETADCSSILDVIDKLGAHYGEHFKDFILDKETCFFLINGKGLMFTGGLNTKLNPDDKIELLPFAHAG